MKAADLETESATVDCMVDKTGYDGVIANHFNDYSALKIVVNWTIEEISG